ncbi:hypothetical protein AV530_008954 [Patagioenas fasciata monilis]|uniref:Uncharacterized protein n=1 Tax=Patagioenas fasciata monilis TaxID=372326 RepID=A0A1V4KHB3_PATFA|nr:hypothetical protein AV530_008954 [Patagioenas fasciata monilis]
MGLGGGHLWVTYGSALPPISAPQLPLPPRRLRRPPSCPPSAAAARPTWTPSPRSPRSSSRPNCCCPTANVGRWCWWSRPPSVAAPQVNCSGPPAAVGCPPSSGISGAAAPSPPHGAPRRPPSRPANWRS